MAERFDSPFRALFLWALLNNMHDMALYLWRFEDECMAKAIAAADIYAYLASQCFANDIPEEKADLLKQYAK